MDVVEILPLTCMNWMLNCLMLKGTIVFVTPDMHLLFLSVFFEINKLGVVLKSEEAVFTTCRSDSWYSIFISSRVRWTGFHFGCWFAVNYTYKWKASLILTSLFSALSF